jgi:sterol desaturase/sphingolipid hydroxylase (fatty acid hydroxylase superfamily)
VWLRRLGCHLNPYSNKSKEDWVLDGLSLIMQGLVIPVLQVTLIYHLWGTLFPTWEHTVHLNGATQFVLSFVGVDYLYYWNHRWLHQGGWDAHKVHHTVTEMDVLGTSRNTLWSSFLIVYLWIHALMLFVIDEPSGYLVGVSLTAALDLWRHSHFSPLANHHLLSSLAYKLTNVWLMLPHDHAWHHSNVNVGQNFGGNFKIWDKVHRTYVENDTFPTSMGLKLNLTMFQKLICPVKEDRC